MEKSLNTIQPLAERMRPKCLDDYIGQEKLISDTGIISQFLKQKNCPSIIFWGNPGVGKTTLAYLIAHELDSPFYCAPILGEEFDSFHHGDPAFEHP